MISRILGTIRSSRRRPRVLALTAVLIMGLTGVAACSTAAGTTTGTTTAASTSLLSTIKARHVVRVGIRYDDPPHSFLNPQGQVVGFDVDIAKAVARELGVRLQIVPVNELTRISYLQDGKIDLAITSISKTVERAREVDFSQTYFWSDQTFLVRKGSGITSLSGLVGKTVGADRGSNAAGQWETWLKSHGHPGNPTVELFSDKQTAVSAVQSGAIAGYAEDYEILASFAKKDPGLTVLNTPGGIGVKLDGIAMHKNDSALMLAVNLALQDIAKSGQYMKIYDEWFGPHSATPVPLQGHIEVWPND
jgi:polar amino acid transport system substrate-binding protein